MVPGANEDADALLPAGISMKPPFSISISVKLILFVEPHARLQSPNTVSLPIGGRGVPVVPEPICDAPPAISNVPPAKTVIVGVVGNDPSRLRPWISAVDA